jgi:aryl-alcohol dehydrogenase-like predicted oxidoreductase
MPTRSDFILGTANLGMQYGISNKSAFNPIDSRKIIAAALKLGIHTFDTSPDYGIAESILGETRQISKNLKTITKIPRMSSYTIENVYLSLKESAAKLGSQTLDGVLFHDPEAHNARELNKISKQILEIGITQKIGFSAYSIENLISGKERNPIWNLFQISENIADRRKTHSSELMAMSSSGDTFQVRSAFLQGLLLMPENEVKVRFQEAFPLVRQLNNIAKEYEVTVLDLCLSYIKRIPWNSSTVIGAASEFQLASIMNYVDIDLKFEELPVLSSQLLDPRNWKIN